jgi:hypothetical protein
LGGDDVVGRNSSVGQRSMQAASASSIAVRVIGASQ